MESCHVGRFVIVRINHLPYADVNKKHSYFLLELKVLCTDDEWARVADLSLIWQTPWTTNKRSWPNVVLMLAQRRRRWANISTTFGQRHVFAGHGQLPKARQAQWDRLLMTAWPRRNIQKAIATLLSSVKANIACFCYNFPADIGFLLLLLRLCL